MANYIGSITRRLESVLTGLSEDFGSLYTRYDIEVKLNELNRLRGNSSDYYSKLGSLMDFLDSMKVQYDDSRTDFEYFEGIVKNMDFPDFDELEGDMLYRLYSIYSNYPAPEEYMLRIVNRLSSEEDNWQDDTLRLRILKQFIKYGNYLYDAGAGGKGYIKKYVKNKFGGKMPSKSSKPSKSGKSDNDELTIILDNIDDEIFLILNDSNKDQKEFSGTYGLIKICDDLASGQFRMGGSTKKNLYLFAMVYNMTFYVGGEGSAEIIDYESDIEKNLFQDYYVNNLMRFLTEAYKDNRSSFEKEPSGQGINYKNFAEMVYLFYISKSDEEYSSIEKIKLSSEMIDRIKEKAFSKETSKIDTSTKTLKDMFCDEILSKSSEDFEQYLLDNYDCNTYVSYGEGKAGSKVSEMQISIEQNTAFECFNDVITQLQDEVDIEDISFGLWFADIEDGYERLSERYPDIDEEKFKKFTSLISEIDKSCKIASRIDEIKTSKEVTRTSVIVAIYHLYNILRENNENSRFGTFEEIYKEFSVMANEVLNKASYQPLSSKNIFDVLIAFSIYAYQMD